MEKADWNTIKKHYNFLVDLNDTARADYLKKIEKKDSELAQKLREMLEADMDDETFLSKPALSKLKEIEEPDFFIGKEIDRYKLMYLLGIGGMGNVYLAERTDLEAHQQVVVKIMNTGYLSSILRKRFDLERKILSRLNHPHITRIYDGGITEQGLPYIVMEFIEGKPLMEYVSDNQLNVEERIELFLDICSAVSYAHQNFIMHRDLKPANILVTHHGIVKVIDFGIAKIVEGDSEEQEQLTKTGILPMTPAYASPEQLTNQPLTIASDIYSLGVIFYEILTENKPFPLTKNTDFSTIEKWITLTDPLKPSSSVSPEIAAYTNLATWKKKIKGDLDNIILKALKKEPTERYLSVEHLIDDINRFRNNYPVLARPDSVSYRVKKYVRRHRFGVAAAVLLFFVLVSGIAATLWQAQVAKTERDLAQYEAAKARQVTDFLIDIFENSDPDNRVSDALTAETMLRKGVENLENLKDQPELHSEMLRVVGRLFRLQHIYVPSRELLEKSLKLSNETYGVDHVEPALTKLELAATLHYLNEDDIAKQYILEAKPIIEDKFGKNSSEYARTLYFLGQFETNKGAYETALDYFNEAENLFSNIDPLADKDWHQLLNLYNGIARIKFMTKDYSNAIQYYHKSLKISYKIEGELSQNISINYYNLSNAFFQSKQIDSAEIYISKSLDLANKLFGDNSNQRSLSGLSLLAAIKSEKGEIDEAEKYAKKALDVAVSIFNKDNFNTAISMYTLGDILIKQKKNSEGEAHILEATSIFEKTLGASHPSLSVVYSENAKNFNAMNKYPQAISYQKKSLEIHKQHFENRKVDKAEMKHKLAEYIQKDSPNNNEIEPLLITSLETYKEELGIADEKTQQVVQSLVNWHENSGRIDKAAEFKKLLDTN